MKDDLDNLFEELSEDEQINEESLSRVWKLAMKDGFVWGIVTAYRDGNEESINQRLQNELKSSVRKKNWGYREIDGVWQEKVDEEPCSENEAAQTKQVSEKSLLVIPPRGTDGQELKDFIVSAVLKYDQDAGIYKMDPEGDADILLYEQRACRDGEIASVPEEEREFPIGKFHANIIDDNFSRLRDGRTFVFKPRKVTDGHSPREMREVTVYGSKKMICELTLEEANTALNDVSKRNCTSFSSSMSRGAMRNSLQEYIEKLSRK